MGLKPDLMVSNTNLVTAILQAEVRTVPLVFISVSDPIGKRCERLLTRNGRQGCYATGALNSEMLSGSHSNIAV